MIIVKLVGGLGNQMFQYAAGRNIVKNHSVKLKLDIGAYLNTYNNKVLKYGLKNLRVIEEFATNDEIKILKNVTPTNVFSIKISLILKYFKIRDNYFNKASHFIESLGNKTCIIMNIKADNIYLDGWFANEHYFKEIRNDLLNEFSLREKLDKKNISILQKICELNSVSVHFRRGDYAKGIHNSYFKLLDYEYYNEAVKYISQRISNPCFFVFSDDIKWAEENIKFPSKTYFIDNNEEAEYKDLYLMRCCKHQIIANSTFSWWAAWLNNFPEKIVVAPNIWYNDKNAQNDYLTNGFIPKSWVKL